MENYNFGHLFNFIELHPEYKNIAIQFSLDNLVSTTKFYKIIKDKFINTDKFFFIIGETSYGACCADEVAAMHLKAELIIRIGTSCLTQTKTLPVYFFYETVNVINEEILKQIEQIYNEKCGENANLIVKSINNTN